MPAREESPSDRGNSARDVHSTHTTNGEQGDQSAGYASRRVIFSLLVRLGTRTDA